MHPDGASMPLERLVSETRAEQLFGPRGRRPFDPGLAERLASMQVGDVFVVDPLPDGVTPRALKMYYNRQAREVGVHLHWRRGDNPVAAEVVADPTWDELHVMRRQRERRNGSG